MTVREKLYNFIERQPSGAGTETLLGLMFNGSGSDPEVATKIVHSLLDTDPNFVYDHDADRWWLRRHLELRVPFSAARFVVVDLETTGGRPSPGSIIEIGAYRLAAGNMAEYFQTLVRPNYRIPRFVVGLTSITNEMVSAAPPIEEVLPRFRDFLGDAVLVAHNAQFDFSFLDFEFRRLFGMGLKNHVVCTLRLARRIWPSLRRRRLDVLAEHFGLSLEGRHRGLGDARMAAELFSIQLEAAEKSGIARLDRLLDFQHQGSSGKKFDPKIAPEVLAALSENPGVYLMRNERDELLYVGKARNLKRRVSSYFNGGLGLKGKTIDLVNNVYSLETIETLSSLEAALLEAKLIRDRKPPFNRMLKSSTPSFFIRLDLHDPFPRLVLSNRLSARTEMLQLGPFIGRKTLETAVRVISRLLGLRVCTGKLQPSTEISPCVYGQMGHCMAPCDTSVDEDDYELQVRKAIDFLKGRTNPIVGRMIAARDQAKSSLRYEEAGRWQRDLDAVRTLVWRERRMKQLVLENNLVILTGASGFERANVVLSGRLARVTDISSYNDACDLAKFISENYDAYRSRPIERNELETTAIVARWLHERLPDEGRLIYLDGPLIPPEAFWSDTEIRAAAAD